LFKPIQERKDSSDKKIPQERYDTNFSALGPSVELPFMIHMSKQTNVPRTVCALPCRVAESTMTQQRRIYEKSTMTHLIGDGGVESDYGVSYLGRARERVRDREVHGRGYGDKDGKEWSKRD
jgi:hypothetical protein